MEPKLIKLSNKSKLSVCFDFHAKKFLSQTSNIAHESSER